MRLPLPLAFAAALAVTTSAFAADDRCAVPAGEWMSVGEIAGKAEAAGYHVREVERDDGCYEIRGTDGSGRRVEVKLHPRTGEVVDVDFDD